MEQNFTYRAVFFTDERHIENYNCCRSLTHFMSFQDKVREAKKNLAKGGGDDDEGGDEQKDPLAQEMEQLEERVSGMPEDDGEPEHVQDLRDRISNLEQRTEVLENPEELVSRIPSDILEQSLELDDMAHQTELESLREQIKNAESGDEIEDIRAQLTSLPSASELTTWRISCGRRYPKRNSNRP